MSFTNSRTNRDRRDRAFARAVIAAAERRRRDDEAREALPEAARCIWCPEPLSNDDNSPYCSASCAVAAEND